MKRRPNPDGRPYRYHAGPKRREQLRELDRSALVAEYVAVGGSEWTLLSDAALIDVIAYGYPDKETR